MSKRQIEFDKTPTFYKYRCPTCKAVVKNIRITDFEAQTPAERVAFGEEVWQKSEEHTCG